MLALEAELSPKKNIRTRTLKRSLGMTFLMKSCPIANPNRHSLKTTLLSEISRDKVSRGRVISALLKGA